MAEDPRRGHEYRDSSFYGNGIPYRYMMPPPAVLEAPFEPNIDQERMAKVYLLSRFVRIFAVIDMVFLLFAAVFTPIYFIGVLFGACGYYGASRYSRGVVAVYLLYVAANVAFRTYVLVRIISIGAESGYALFIATSVISILISAYIAYLIISFIRLMGQLTPDERRALNLIENPPVLYTYYPFYGGGANAGRAPGPGAAPSHVPPSAPAEQEVLVDLGAQQTPGGNAVEYPGAAHHLGDAPAASSPPEYPSLRP